MLLLTIKNKKFIDNLIKTVTVENLSKEKKFDTIILDDGFQDPSIKKDLTINGLKKVILKLKICGKHYLKITI